MLFIDCFKILMGDITCGGNLDINGGGHFTTNCSSKIIGIQCGSSTGSGGTTTVYFSPSFINNGSYPLVVTLTAMNNGSNGQTGMNCPLLVNSYYNYFQWVPYYSYGTGYKVNGNYIATWIAIQYDNT
jgi:hypothetical protein